MAEAQAAPDKAQPQQQQQQQVEGEPLEKKEEPAGKVYSQEEVDRIAAKVRKNARREERIAAERDYLREQQARQQQPEKKDPPKENVEPQRDDFETYEEWQREVTRFEARKASREEREKGEKEAKAKTERESQETAARTWHGKIEKAMEKIADFEEVLEDESETLTLVQNAPMRAFITESDIGPEIVYELCKNPAEAKRIAALPAYKQAAEIAKIEDKLVAAGKPKEEEKKGDDDAPDDEEDAAGKAVRNADGTFKPKEPPKKDLDEPIEPVGSRGSSANSSLPSDKDDPETWRRKEVARMAKLRAGK